MPSGLVDYFGVFSLGEARSADLAHTTVTASCGAVFPPIENDLKVQVVPSFPSEYLFEISLGLVDIAAAGESPALRQPVDMRVDGKARYPEGLRHHHRCGLVSYARKSL